MSTARAPKLRRAMRDASKAGHASAVIDGTLIPIDRGYAGPGAVHDLSAAPIWGLIQALAASGVVVMGDKGHLGEDTPHAMPQAALLPLARLTTGRGNPRPSNPRNRSMKRAQWERQ